MEEKNKKNDEIISRREFFKGATKKALPILGALALVNLPIFAKAAKTPSDCEWGCYGGCSTSCLGCSGSCTGYCTSCQGSCSGYCTSGCKGGCTGCQGYCTGSNH